ncbi:phage tail protein [Brenneria uluponensis]|uniref:phage tail protein n=1 Tax=Brenneria uluponensis TaxID=3057057 RepID=UPI0028E8C2B2|nr:tail fiber protein [Brenneria ulupoensis]
MLKKMTQLLPVSPAIVLVAGIGITPAFASACGTEPFIGEVCTFAFNYCPDGYLPADGRQLLVNSYQALFSLFGYTYGGSGNNFALPDLRGRSAIGAGYPGSYGAQLNTEWGQRYGSSTTTLVANQLPGHTHPAVFAPVSGPQTVNIPGTTGDLNVSAYLPVSTSTGTTPTLSTGQTGYLSGLSGRSGSLSVVFNGPYTTINPSTADPAMLPAKVSTTGNASTAATDITIKTVTGGAVTVGPNSTGLLPVSTQSPSLGLKMCIAIEGVYPVRPN